MTVVLPTRESPTTLNELRTAVGRLQAAATQHEGLSALEALGDVDELWAHLRPTIALRAGAAAAAAIDEGVANLHLLPDWRTREAVCADLGAVVRRLSAAA